MLSSLQSKNVVFLFPEASCEAWFDDVNSSVFKSSSVAGSGGEVSSYSSPLLWGERGAGKGKALKREQFFSLTEVLCCVTDKSHIYMLTVLFTCARWYMLK